MKRKQVIRIMWAVVSIIMIFTMVLWTVAAAFLNY